MNNDLTRSKVVHVEELHNQRRKLSTANGITNMRKHVTSEDNKDDNTNNLNYGIALPESITMILMR